MEAQQATPPAPRLYNPQERAISNRYTPRHMRPAARVAANQVIDDGFVTPPEIMDAGIPGYAGYGEHEVGAPVSEVIVGDGGFGGGCHNGYCGGDCADCGGCGPTFDPRDCGITRDCWFGGLGQLLCNAEYFAGVHAFKHQVFQDVTGQRQPDNCSFGFHYGFNAGLPLYNLTCGVLSGQIGVSSANSNLEDGVFATGDRQQTFVTVGLYRRVDYGLQFGAVADFMHEEFISTLDIVQMRAELSWVWAGGSNFGFRFTENIQDDDGFIGGVFLPQISGQAIDTYRLFYRRACCSGGYMEFFAGRSDEQHTIYGADFDLPISARMALYSGFNYLQPDDDLALTDNEAWNLSMGISFRPRGREWYKFYHRPLFRVADNGSMVQSRRP